MKTIVRTICFILVLLSVSTYSQPSIILQPAAAYSDTTYHFFSQNEKVLLQWSPASSNMKFRIGTSIGNYGLTAIPVSGTSATFVPSDASVGLSTGRYYGIVTNSDKTNLSDIQKNTGSSYSNEIQFVIESSTAPSPTSPRGTTTSGTPLFQWNSIAGVSAYWIIVSSTPFVVRTDTIINSKGKITTSASVRGANIVWDYIATGTSALYGQISPTSPFTKSAIPLFPGNSYYYTILNMYDPTDVAFASTIFGGVVSFTYQSETVVQAPNLIAPADSAVFQGTSNIRFQWDPVTNANSYTVYLFNRVSQFNGSNQQIDLPIWNGTTTNTQLDFNAKTNLLRGKYVWFVIPNTSTGAGNASSKRSFNYEVQMSQFRVNLINSENGNSLVNYSVQVNSTTGGYSPPVPYIISNSVTLRDSLPSDFYQFTGKKSGFFDSTITVAVNGGTTTDISSVNIYVRPYPSTLSGTVNDQSGAALISATVQITNVITNATLSSSTSSSGGFSISAPQGTYKITVSKPGYLSPSQSTVTVDAGQLNISTPFVLRLDNANISGKVVNDAGSAIQLATVRATKANVVQEVVSDGTGSYSFALSSGTWTIEVSKTGFVSPTAASILLATGDNKTNQNLILIPRANQITGLVSRVVPSGTQSNVVPYAGVTVTATPLSGAVVTVVTGTNGQYLLSLTGGTYSITAQASGYTSTKVAQVTVAVGQTLSDINFSLVPNPSSVSGNITETGGASLGDVVVSNGSVSTVSLSTGGYLLSLPAGSHTISVTKSGYVTPQSLTVNISPGQNLSGINFTMAPNASTITGTVNSLGLSLAGATITAKSGTQDLSTVADINGNFTLSVQLGTYKLIATKQGFLPSAPDSFYLGAGQISINHNFTLIENKAIIKGVVSSSGQQLSGASVSVKQIEDPTIVFTTITNISGEYIVNVPGGASYNVVIAATGYSASTVASDGVLAAKSTKVINATLKPVPALISGKVTDNLLQVISGVTVYLYNNTSGTLVDSTKTNVSGDFSIGTTAGSVKLKTTYPGYTSDSVAVSISFGQTLSGINLKVNPNFASLSGIVKSLKDTLSGARISVTGATAGGTAVSSKSGYSIQQLITGTYTVNVQKDGYRDSTILNYPITDGFAKTLDFTLVALTGKLSGMVTDAGANGIPDATVYATDSVSGITYSAITDASGAYQLAPLPFSVYKIIAAKAKYNSAQKISVTLTSAQTAVVASITDLNKNNSKITGKITDASGTALPGAQISIRGVGGSGTTTTDLNGAFSISDLVAGVYSITISKSSYVDTTFTQITDNVLAVVLKPSNVKITGTVKNQIGGSLGFVVAVKAISGLNVLTSNADTTGAFSFDGANSGATYTLATQIFREGYTNDDSVCTIPSGSFTFGPIPLFVKITKSVISGNVGIASATVRVKNSATNEEMTTVSSSDGSYSINFLSNATYTITPEKAGYTFSPANSQAVLGVLDSKKIDFTPNLNTGSLIVTVKDNGGSAVSTASVTIIRSDTLAQFSSLTSTEGIATFANIPAGTYYLRAQKTGYGSVSKTVTVNKSASISDNASVTITKNIASISGVVKSTKGGLLANAGVSYRSPTGLTINGVTDANGLFFFTNLPSDTAIITASLQGYISTSKQYPVSAGNDTIKLQPAFVQLLGKVQYKGTGLPNVTVTATSSSATSVVTNSAGWFTFPNLPIKIGDADPADTSIVYAISISSGDFLQQTQSVVLTKSKSERSDTLKSVFIVPSDSINLTITDGNTALGGVSLAFVRPDGTVAQTVTDSKGNFTTSARLSAGTYKITIAKDGYLIPDEKLTAFAFAANDSTITRQIELRYRHTPLQTISATSSATVLVNYNVIASTFEAYLHYKQGNNPEVLVPLTKDASTKTLTGDIPALNSIANVTYYVTVKELIGSLSTFSTQPVTLTPEAAGLLSTASFEPEINNISMRLNDAYSVKVNIKDGKNNSLSDQFNGTIPAGSISWESSDSLAFKIVVNSNDKTIVNINPLKEGTFKLTAVVKLRGTIVRQFASVAVSNVSLKNITVTSPVSVLDNKSQGIQFTYAGTDSSAKTISLGNSLQWSINPADGGTIDSTGFFKPADSTFIGLITATAVDKLGGKQGATDVLLFAEIKPSSSITLTNKQGMFLQIFSGSVDFPIQLTLARSQFGPGKKYYAPVGSGASYVASDRQYIFEYSADRALVGNKLKRDANLIVPVDNTLRLFDGDKTVGYYDIEFNEWHLRNTTSTADGLSAVFDSLGEYSVLVSNEPLGITHASVLPNPFSPQVSPVKIGYKLSTTQLQAHVTISVYNVRGDLVRTILKDDPQFPAIYGPDPAFTSDSRKLIFWDGRTDGGYEALNGRYIIRILAKDPTGEVSKLLPVVLVK